MKGKKISVGILSLGCPKTLVESELVLGGLDPKRFQVASHITDCDVAIVNTCAFIGDAKEESIEHILKLIELKKEGGIRALIVMGCLPQRYPEELKREFREVDAFLGTGEYGRVSEVLTTLFGKKKLSHPLMRTASMGYLHTAREKRFALTPKHFRYLKVSEGCDHQCSFCTIPSFRGPYRSRRPEDIVQEAAKLAREGCRELILTGQDTSHYGKDLAGRLLLSELLEELNGVRGIKWIRLLYLHPLYVPDALIDAVQRLPRVCHYLDLPLQHVSDPILKSMKRGVDRAKIVDLIYRLRARIPDLALRTSFIVGYPGETDAQFDELMQFIEEIKFERLGVFIYSQEEKTLAARLKHQISEKVKRDRFSRMMELQQDLSRQQNEKWVGKILEVLVDGKSEDEENVYVGRSYLDAPEVDGMVLIHAPAGKKLKPGDFVPVRIDGAREYDLVGTAEQTLGSQ